MQALLGSYLNYYFLLTLCQLIVCGLGKIDVNDWKSNTRLKHCTPDSNIVKWFWRAVESFDEERRARLLQFVTGSSRVPLQGFKALQGKTSPSDLSQRYQYNLAASANKVQYNTTAYSDDRWMLVASYRVCKYLIHC